MKKSLSVLSLLGLLGYLGYLGYLLISYSQEKNFYNEFQSGLTSYTLGNYQEANHLFSKLSHKNPHSPELFHNLGNTLVILTSGDNSTKLEKALQSYQQSLNTSSNQDTQFNYDLVKEFLEKKKKEGKKENKKENLEQNKQQNQTGDPSTNSGGLENNIDTGSSVTQQSANQQSGSGQPVTDNGQELSKSDLQQLQDYQQQLQHYQETMSNDFNKQVQSDHGYPFGGSLFEQFFGIKDPFQESLPQRNKKDKDW